MWWLINLGE
ncbi:hypothetical protein YPPY03_1555, partial [Yersinia pestis PY-03]